MSFLLAEVRYDSTELEYFTPEIRANSIEQYRSYTDFSAQRLKMALNHALAYNINNFADDLTDIVKKQANILGDCFTTGNCTHIFFAGKSRYISKKLFHLSMDHLARKASQEPMCKQFEFNDSQNQLLYLEDDLMSPQGRGSMDPMQVLLQSLDQGAKVLLIDDHCSAEALKSRFIGDLVQTSGHQAKDKFSYLVQSAPDHFHMEETLPIPSNVVLLHRDKHTSRLMSDFSILTSALVFDRMYQMPGVFYDKYFILTSKQEVPELKSWYKIHSEFRTNLWQLVEANLMTD